MSHGQVKCFLAILGNHLEMVSQKNAAGGATL